MKSSNLWRSLAALVVAGCAQAAGAASVPGTCTGNDPHCGNTSTATVTTTSSLALTVSKSVTSTGPYNSVGQAITYKFVAVNTGNVTLTSVGITDTQTAPAGALTSGPTCQSLSSPAGSCSGSTTTLLPGQFATFTATYTITQADLNNGPVNDSATSSGTPPSGPPVTSPPSTATVTTTSSPTLNKAFGAASIAVGTTTSLTFTINNPNTSAALTGIGFSDTLPSGLAIATPNGLSGSCGGGTITATQNTIVISLSGATLASSTGCTFSVNVVATGAGSKTNTTGAITSIEGGTGATATASLTVNQSSTTTTLTTACMTTFVANQSFTMMAMVSGYSPTGNSAFYDGGVGITGCTAVVLSGGTVDCVTSTLPTGVRNLTAAYGGDVNNLSSNSASLFVSVLVPTDVLFRNGFEAVIAGCPSE
jgi:uncharacterized repeat protein (TIGR01451 family)